MATWRSGLPPTFISLDPSAIHLQELSSLLAATGQNCLQFPPQPPEFLPASPRKLRLALRHSTVVVSIHMKCAHIPGGDYFSFPDCESASTPSFDLRNVLSPPFPRRLIAFGRAISDEAFTASIFDLTVAPSLQRRGLGKRVLQRLIRELTRRGISDIAALTTPELRFKPFFMACGFREDELQSTTMMYLRSCVHSDTNADTDHLKLVGRKHLFVPAALTNVKARVTSLSH